MRRSRKRLILRRQVEKKWKAGDEPRPSRTRFCPLNHLVAPDSCRGQWKISIGKTASHFVVSEECLQVCGKNSHSFWSVRPNDIG
ncbi:hypothetical protein PDJAM_G00173090 [Pangasius djambal]|uniref:Uncharacterized protein n=1 Tax=Pangasius djambal TaxID=1691987 RepID=A0ACC5ZPE8_9TELE|nr:hypothetical protein [Pangasius djambal]